MRTFTPIIIQDNKGLYYEPLTIEKAIIFGERNKNKKVIFQTEANNIVEYLDVKQLKEMQL